MTEETPTSEGGVEQHVGDVPICTSNNGAGTDAGSEVKIGEAINEPASSNPPESSPPVQTQQPSPPTDTKPPTHKPLPPPPVPHSPRAHTIDVMTGPAHHNNSLKGSGEMDGGTTGSPKLDRKASVATIEQAPGDDKKKVCKAYIFVFLSIKV